MLFGFFSADFTLIEYLFWWGFNPWFCHEWDGIYRFKERVGQAAKHPRFKSAQASLEAAFAQVKGSESYLRPQLSVILDSNNAISRKYADDPTNLVERSQADHKTNVRFTINQLLHDFGATRYDISRSEALAKASRAQLSSNILELLYQSTGLYWCSILYKFEKVVEDLP